MNSIQHYDTIFCLHSYLLRFFISKATAAPSIGDTYWLFWTNQTRYWKIVLIFLEIIEDNWPILCHRIMTLGQHILWGQGFEPSKREQAAVEYSFNIGQTTKLKKWPFLLSQNQLYIISKKWSLLFGKIIVYNVWITIPPLFYSKFVCVFTLKS